MSIEQQKPFTEQFVRSQHRVYGFIVTLLPNRDDADEAFQETCLILWDKWAEFDPTRDFVRWACGIAHNVVRNYRRSQQRTAVTLSDDLLAEIALERLDNDPLLEARHQALSACLEKLTVGQRKLVEESYQRGQEIRLVAEQMAVTPATLYLRLQRIRRKLFECVDRALRSGGAS
jgi:RNA polymerase sigma-70 factor (ECF subfamily)